MISTLRSSTLRLKHFLVDGWVFIIFLLKTWLPQRFLLCVTIITITLSDPIPVWVREEAVILTPCRGLSAEVKRATLTAAVLSGHSSPLTCCTLTHYRKLTSSKYTPSLLPVRPIVSLWQWCIPDKLQVQCNVVMSAVAAARWDWSQLLGWLFFWWKYRFQVTKLPA